MTLHRKKCLSEGKEKKNTQSKFFEVIKRSKVKNVTYRSKLGLLGFICVMIQSDEVESRFNLVTATTEHVISAYALTAHLITPAGRQGVKKVRSEEKLKWNKLTGGVSETFYCRLHAGILRQFSTPTYV